MYELLVFIVNDVLLPLRLNEIGVFGRLLQENSQVRVVRVRGLPVHDRRLHLLNDLRNELLQVVKGNLGLGV